jgi:ABC-type lipopolysaccharide export system ATPase subunit
MDLFRYFCLKAYQLISEIHTQQLIKAYGRRTVVNNVSVNVKQGEIVGLLGPNGAGKTTTFYMVVGLIKPDNGMVFLDKEEITGMAHVSPGTTRDRLLTPGSKRVPIHER